MNAEAGGQEAHAAEMIREAQAGVRSARQALVSPTAAALDGSAPHLERAVASLRKLENSLRSGPLPSGVALMPELSHLRREVSMVRTLIDNAAAIHLGWARLLASAAGYTPQGEPALPTPAPRLSMEG